jgi:putative transposase
MAWLVRRTYHRPTRDRGFVASCWLPSVLAEAISVCRRPKLDKEVRELIRRMKADKPTWGAPRIHGELLSLDSRFPNLRFSRYLQPLKRRSDEGKTMACVPQQSPRGDRGCDFFTVPTLRFRTLYCFFVIEHGRRRILHFNCTTHPNSDWIVRQLRDALPLPCRYRYMLFDHDAKFGTEVVAFLNASGTEPLRTSVRSPWQNGTAERWVGSARREMFDHTIPLNESHLRRLGREYLAYYHEDRTHLGLAKATPAHRAVEQRPTATRRIHSQPRMGGLHHRYGWTAAA